MLPYRKDCDNSLIRNRFCQEINKKPHLIDFKLIYVFLFDLAIKGKEFIESNRLI